MRNAPVISAIGFIGLSIFLIFSGIGKKFGLDNTWIISLNIIGVFIGIGSLLFLIERFSKRK